MTTFKLNGVTFYNHALTIGFEVYSNDQQGEDITAEMVTSALLRRISKLNDANQMLDAVDIFDTYEDDTNEDTN